MSTINLNNVAAIGVGDLPSVPHVLLKLIDTCHDVDASFDELTRLIREDATLCAKILEVTSTPTYAQWNGITDFNRLLVILGIQPIKSIAITAVVQQFFSQFDDCSGECLGLLWRESLTCAHAAKALAALTGYASEDEAYLTGLLHNLGKLVILKLHPEQYGSFLLESNNRQDALALERKLVGVTSAEVGAALLNEWASQSFVGDAIQFQSSDSEELTHASHLIKIINLSHKLSLDGFHDDGIAQDAMQLLGLNQTLLDDLAAQIRNSVLGTASDYGIDLASDKPVNLDDQETRLQLAKRVKGFALLQAAANPGASGTTIKSAWEEITRTLNILFGLQSSIVFEPDEPQTILASTAVTNAISIPESLKVPLNSNRSVICLASTSGQPVFSDQEGNEIQPSVLDHQIKRILDRSTFIALPIMDSTQVYGVIAAGVTEQQYATLQQNLPLIKQYLSTASESLRQQVSTQKLHQDEMDQLRAKHSEETRKLVHEANNPIGVIKNYLHALSIKLDKEEEVEKQLNTVKSEIDRVADIISRMRDVAYDQSSDTKLVTTNINQVIRDLVALYSNSIFASHNILEKLDLDDSIESLEIKKSSLSQVITNLVKNAVEAMPEGGLIKIATSNDVYLNGEAFVEIRIADDGPGIPQHILKNIFTPVKSTKGANHSGLGLSIVHNLITDMGGTINFQNKKSGGAEFTLYLPKTTADQLS